MPAVGRRYGSPSRGRRRRPGTGRPRTPPPGRAGQQDGSGRDDGGRLACLVEDLVADPEIAHAPPSAREWGSGCRSRAPCPPAGPRCRPAGSPPRRWRPARTRRGAGRTARTPAGSTSLVSSGCSSAGSMCGYRWFSNTRKYRSSRTSMLAGWMSSGVYGSSLTRPDSTSALMSRSESSTLATYLFRYDVGATELRPGSPVSADPGPRRGRSRGCSSMAERQLPKLIVRVRFSSPALITFAQVGMLRRPLGMTLASIESLSCAIGVPLLTLLLPPTCWIRRRVSAGCTCSQQCDPMSTSAE